jgi:hypothetical protein
MSTIKTEVTPTRAARERVIWLTDHPGCSVADYDRVRAPSPRKAIARREHSEYLDWFNSVRVMRLLGLPPMDPEMRADFENSRAQLPT